MDNNSDIQKLRLELFENAGLKVDLNDPIIQLWIIQKSLISESHLEFQKNLNTLGDCLINEIKDQHKEILSDFDEKTEELNNTLKYLENAKMAIVDDVWKKLASKVQQQIQTDMQAIARNANNKVNNQKNMLLGGVAGLLIGLVLCVILFMLK